MLLGKVTLNLFPEKEKNDWNTLLVEINIFSNLFERENGKNKL